MKWVQSDLGDWVEEFFPCSDSEKEAEDMEKLEFKPFEIDMSSETTMHHGLADMFNNYLTVTGCTEFVVRYIDINKDTHNPGSTENREHNPSKPDLAFLPTSDEGKRAYEIGQKLRENGGKKAESPQHASDSAAASSFISHATSLSQPLCTSDGSAASIPQSVPGAATTPPHKGPIVGTPDGDGSLDPSDPRIMWAFAEVVVEVERRTHQYSVFVTEETARGQLTDYASELFRHQHRAFLFLISICDEYARFLRFDRCGAVVSRTIDYIKHPKAMGMILYRLFGPRSSRELRGHDPTATRADSADAELFRGLSTNPDYQADTNLVAALAHAATVNWPIYKIEIPYQWPGADEQIPVRRNSVYPITTREFLVGRPAFSSSSMTGRGTKCMVAYDKTAKKPVFLKDMWRPDSSRLQTELQTYQQLWDGENSVRVAYIPTCLGGGDVSHDGKVQRTRTHRYLGEQGHLARIHSRIVLKEICRRLVDFKHTVELVSCVFDAVQAHERAWKRGILHRDVSVGNILLLDVWNGVKWITIGLLADWDLAKTKEQLEDFSPTQTFRSGTWQFMSAQLQYYKDKRHEISDDLESFLHVLDWCSFKYLPHSLSSSPRNLAYYMRALYDESVPIYDADGLSVASKSTEEKYAAASSPVNVVRGLPLDHPFTKMLSRLHELCWRHYSITRPVPLAEETDEDTSMVEEQLSKLVRFHPELTTRQTGTASAQAVNLVTSQETASTGSSSSASLGVGAISGLKETSPLQDHSQFMQIMADALVTALTAGRWPTIKKDMAQAQGLPSTAGTPLASRTGSKRTMESGDADASRPQKRQKPTGSRADEDEDEDDHIDDGDDPFGSVEGERSAQDAAAADSPVVSEEARPSKTALSRFLTSHQVTTRRKPGGKDS